MKKRMLLAAALIAFAAFAAFADVGMYIKGALGYGYRTRPWDWDVTTIATEVTEEFFGAFDFHLFTVVPTFGIEPWRGNDDSFLSRLSFEFSVDLGFGKVSRSDVDDNITYIYDNGTAILVNPRIMAVYTHRIGIIAPYGGLGISVPIAIVPDFGGDAYGFYDDGNSYHQRAPTVKVGFNGNIMAGVGFAVTPAIMPVVEVDFGFGTALPGIRVDVRAGLVYKFGI